MKKVCPGCGTRTSEWLKDKFAYVGQAEICRGCETIEIERANVPEEAKGAKVYLAPRATARPPEDHLHYQ